MKDVSFLIPARNEKFLGETVRNVLSNIRGNSEVLVYLDGWKPDPPLHFNDDRVIFHYSEKAIGQRAAINYLAKKAKGKYVCKLDAHCAIGESFDTIMMADCEPDWTVIPRMRNLDTKTWEPRFKNDWKTAVKGRKLHDYLYIGINGKDELRTLYYPDRENWRLHSERKDILIDETMSCMGCCFFMERDRYWELGGCDEGHEGGWGQQAVEISCKAWLSGGKLMVNKKTWFAHWFRAGDGGFPYPISGNQINRVRAYSKDLWLNNKWKGAKRDFNWLINKFSPPNRERLALDAPIDPPRLNHIHRHIRNYFKLLTRDDFSPICGREGDRNTLIKLWNKLGYREGAEIGVRVGNYSRRIMDGVKGVRLHCIDPWDEYKDGTMVQETQDQYFARAMRNLQPYIDRGSCILHKEYSEHASRKFEDGSLDFLFIDGNHSFDGVCLDLIKWVPKVRRGGMIALHDYCNMRRGGVVKAVDAYTYCHMIHPWYVTRKEEFPTAFWVVE